MTTTLSVRASDTGSGGRAFQWPVLESGNISFEAGVYSVTCEDNERGKSIFVNHQIDGAPLIRNWMRLGCLLFVCTVASPRSMYRALHKDSHSRHLIQWDEEDLGDFPTFTPMIIAGRVIRHRIDARADGLSGVWDGRSILIPKGGRLAVGPNFRFQSGISELLNFNLDQSLEDGQFRVEPSPDDGFIFKVYLANDLHRHLRHGHLRSESAGWNVMVHIVSAAMACLSRQEYGDDGEEGWQSFPNLVGLADVLATKGLSHWTDKDFRPEIVATSLYPHNLSGVSFNYDDER